MRNEHRLTVKFMGVRGSIPTPGPENLGFGGNTTCLEVRSSAGDVLVIDAGSGARKLGLALAGEFAGRKLDLHLLLTHFHWDHIQGIPFFAPLFGPANCLTFHSSRPPEKVRAFLAGQMLDPYFPIGFDNLPARREFAQMEYRATRLGGIQVHPFPLNHPQGATGYRLEAGGAVIVHASDLEHGDPRLDSVLRDHAEGADVLIYDAQYSPEEYESRRGWGHSTWLEATRVARDAHVKQLVLFHHDPGHDDGTLQDFVHQARRTFENTEAAKEGWATSSVAFFKESLSSP
jgi:phosphoribosyl 1,2-cyclic phosphodiesterase